MQMSSYETDLDQKLRHLINLRKTYAAELEECERRVPGRLVGTHRNGRQNYFQVESGNGNYNKHGISRDEDSIRTLCRKAYIREVIKNIDQNIDTLNAAIKGYVKLDYKRIMQNLAPIYQTVPEEYCLSSPFTELLNSKDALLKVADDDIVRRKKIEKWISEPYEKSTFMSEHRTNITSRGERMRSKGEVAIAEIFYRLGIPFHYEEVLHIGDSILVPDFHALRIRDLKLFYLEHCGLPFNEQYMEKHKKKLQLYESVGIVPWDNLIVTYNDKNGNMDMRIIESEIKSKLL